MYVELGKLLSLENYDTQGTVFKLLYYMQKILKYGREPSN